MTDGDNDVSMTTGNRRSWQLEQQANDDLGRAPARPCATNDYVVYHGSLSGAPVAVRPLLRACAGSAGELFRLADRGGPAARLPADRRAAERAASRRVSGRHAVDPPRRSRAPAAGRGAGCSAAREGSTAVDFAIIAPGLLPVRRRRSRVLHADARRDPAAECGDRRVAVRAHRPHVRRPDARGGHRRPRGGRAPTA